MYWLIILAILVKGFSELTKEDFQEAYDVNVFGAVAMIQTVIPFMKKKNGHGQYQ